jgi:hypothetical protein
MSKVRIKPFNVIDNTDLPEMTVNQLPADGDPSGIVYQSLTKGYNSGRIIISVISMIVMK